jgi:hypothetical protein
MYLRRFVWCCAATVLISYVGLDRQHVQADDTVPSIACGLSSATVKILETLEDDSRLEFIETPLEQVVDFLKDQHDIPIGLDVSQLEGLGIGSDTPITLNLRGISLRSGMRSMLRPLKLDIAVINDVLMITTPEVAARVARVRVYAVTELIGDDSSSLEIAQVVERVVARHGGPVTFQGDGGGIFSVPELPVGQFGMGGMGGGFEHPAGDSQVAGTPLQITPFRELIIVRGTDDQHREVAELLAALKAALKAG